MFIKLTLIRQQIMNLPLINNRNKPNPKTSHPLAQSAPSLEEFGLGIQVFKIQATKGLDSKNAQPRKLMRNIENPTYSQPEPPPKRTQVLPSLSCEKRDKAAMLEAGLALRRTAIERKKPAVVADTIKEVEEKQQVGKKISSAQQTAKGNPPYQAPIPQEQQIIQPHYRVSFNELTNFYAELRQNEAQNAKELRRLRKMKENADAELLERAIRLRDNKSELVQQMAETKNIECFFTEEIYDEFSITAFVDGSGRFRFEDQNPFPARDGEEEDDD